MAYLLGIDQGTTQTTAVVLNGSERVVARASMPLATRFPRPGYVEQDPWDILNSVRHVVDAVVADYPIAAAGLANQGETFLVWEAATGQPLTPAIVWQDKRGVAICQSLAQRVDSAWLQHKTGLLLDTYFSAPKLQHVLRSDRSLGEAAWRGELRFGTIDTWLIWQLSNGRLHITDPSTASRTMLFDINSLSWDDGLLSLFDIPRALLPEVRRSAGYVGDLNFGAGHIFPLYATLVDQQAALFGQACFQPGDMKCTFGTGSFLLMNSGGTPRLSSHGLLTTIAWQRQATVTYALDGGVFVSGAAIQWLVDNLHLLPDAAASAQVAAAARDESITFVPALAGLAAPYWLPDVRGALFGVTRATTAADIVRATLEGIACRVYEVIKAMEEDSGRVVSMLKVDGGPSANSFLMQSLADLLGSEVQVAEMFEATAVGAANLAEHAALGTSLDELASRWRAAAIYYPHLSAAGRAERLQRWRRAVAAVRAYHAA